MGKLQVTHRDSPEIIIRHSPQAQCLFNVASQKIPKNRLDDE
jgi:hypothetical protein